MNMHDDDDDTLTLDELTARYGEELMKLKPKRRLLKRGRKKGALPASAVDEEEDDDAPAPIQKALGPDAFTQARMKG